MVEEEVLNKIYEEILKNRTEIKECIETSESRLLVKIEQLNNRLNKLEQQNSDLQNRIQILEEAARKNNVVIFGIKNQNGQISVKTVIDEINNLLNINLTEADLNNIYTLGKVENSPIKIEFLSYLKKSEVIQNTPKLKDTGIYIVQDLTKEQRQQNKILKKHLVIAKQKGSKNCYIKKNILYVDKEIYTLKQLLEKEEIDEDNCYQGNNTPATPVPVIKKKQDAAIVSKVSYALVPTQKSMPAKNHEEASCSQEEKKRKVENKTNSPLLAINKKKKEGLRSHVNIK